MTVQYNQLVLTGGPGVFFKLLLKWRGCVFKLIYIDLIIYVTLYYIISFSYRFGMNEYWQRKFENLVDFVDNFQYMIPVAFILGFYINLIFSRFWHQFMAIPWVLKFSMLLAANLPVKTERCRLIRRTCLRYLLASLILTSTRLNVVAKKRFPTPESFVEAGIFTEEEMRLILETQPTHIQPFVPLVWTTSLITLAAKEQFIKNHHTLVLIINELNTFRQGLLNLFLMDYICVPLVYTQVVTLSVYSYFIVSLIGRQYLLDDCPIAVERGTRDFYVPFFTLIEFIIYVGWLKVAETLVNPMGEDDEDLDINEVIDFNWKVGWCIVDGMQTAPPAVVRDVHWHHSVVELPHTGESKRLEAHGCRGSVYDINVPELVNCGGSMLSLNLGRHSQDMSAFRRPWNLSTASNPTRRPSEDAGDGAIDMEEGGVGKMDYLEVPTAVPNLRASDASAGPLLASTMGVTETIQEEDEEAADAEDTSKTSSDQGQDSANSKQTIKVIVQQDPSSDASNL